MRSMAWAAAVSLAATLLTACGGSPDTTPPLSGATTTASAVTAPPHQPPPPAVHTVKWVDLDVGDCLAEPPPADPAVVTVAVVDCAAPHRAETYLRAPIPVNAALADVADADCAAGLPRYTGTQAATHPYTTTYLIDSEQDRTFDNPYPSTVICLLQGADDQPLTGSARR